MSIPRVVLDTNCLISALVFSRSKFAWLREAWQTKRFTALASHDTVCELLRDKYSQINILLRAGQSRHGL